MPEIPRLRLSAYPRHTTPDYYVFTDGSGGKAGPGGWAAVVVKTADFSQPDKVLVGCATWATIGRLEALSMMESLSYLLRVEQPIARPLHVCIITDAEYCARLLSGDGSPRKNRDVWLGIFELQTRLLVSAIYNSRNTHAYMELADRLSKIARIQVAQSDALATATVLAEPAGKEDL